MTESRNAVVSQAVVRVQEELETVKGELTGLSHRIYDHPELRFEEHDASKLLQGLLSGKGFDVTPAVAGMPTAFLAQREFGSGGPTIGVFCEFDALAGIGHACGHNVIAAAGAGAAIGADRVLRAGGQAVNGRILVLGSPGEEGGGGKIRMIEAGLMAGIDVAIMVHPAGFDAVERPNLGRVSLEVEFAGKASHAASAPEQGVNALDAATLMLVSVGLLRQQLRSDSRVHAIVIDGGDAVNVIPERSKLRVFVRSPDLEYLRGRLEPAVRACADGAALATGTTGSVREVAPAYEPLRHNKVLAALAAEAFQSAGRPVGTDHEPGGTAGSTDMGNVSQVLPAIHPYIRIGQDIPGHTHEFAAAARSKDGDQAAADGAAILGGLIVSLLENPELVTEAKLSFSESAASPSGVRGAR